MAKRQVIKIDQEKCDGCGMCVPSCAEGAIQIVDGKAQLLADKFCDGLGACLGECPQGALTVEAREADEFVGPAPGARRPWGPSGAGARSAGAGGLRLPRQPHAAVSAPGRGPGRRGIGPGALAGETAFGGPQVPLPERG